MSEFSTLVNEANADPLSTDPWHTYISLLKRCVSKDSTIVAQDRVPYTIKVYCSYGVASYTVPTIISIYLSCLYSHPLSDCYMVAWCYYCTVFTYTPL